MNLTDLKVFVEIVNAKTITSAADNLFISSSTVGSHLKSLENKLGYELLTRSKGSRSVTLTHDGTRFLQYALEIIDTWDKALAIPTKNKSLNIGMSSSFVNLFSHAYTQFQLINQEIPLGINILDSEVSYQQLLHHEIQIGIIMFPENHHETITTKISEEPLVLAYSNEYQHLATAEKVSVFDFPLQNQLAFDWKNDFDTWYKEIDYSDFTSSMRFNSAQALSTMFNNNSWAIVPLSIAQSLKQSKDVNFKYIKENPPARSVYYATHVDNANDSLILQFVTLLENEIEQTKTNF